MTQTAKKAITVKGYQATISVSGPGVLHVRASEILKTDEAQRQINGLNRMREEGYRRKSK